MFFLVWRADWLLIYHERASTLVMVLGCIGGKPRIGQGAAQQQVKMWHMLFRDRGTQRTGKSTCCLWEHQICVFNCKLPYMVVQLTVFKLLIHRDIPLRRPVVISSESGPKLRKRKLQIANLCNSMIIELCKDIFRIFQGIAAYQYFTYIAVNIYYCIRENSVFKVPS